MIQEILIEALQFIFITGFAGSVFLGLIILFKPSLIERISGPANAWYSSRKGTKPLEIRREVDLAFMNNHKTAGWLLFFASFGSLILVLTRVPSDPFTSLTFINDGTLLLVNLFFNTMKWSMIIFSIAGLVVALFKICLPATMKTVNKFFNQWISTRNILHPLERMDYRFDAFVLRYSLFFGIFFCIGGIFNLLYFPK